MNEAASFPISPITLASQSPRRLELLLNAGYRIQQQSPQFDDALLTLHQTSVAERVMALAWFKAQAIPQPHQHELILASDTLLSYQNQHLGKVHSKAAAESLLRKLNGQWHQAWTGLALWSPQAQQRIISAHVTAIRFTLPAEEHFQRYLNESHWKGKAGAYNLGELKEAWQFEVQGDESTVIGLPMHRLPHLIQYFKRPEG